MKRFAAWLERDGHDTAAASLKEAIEETLTVVKLGLAFVNAGKSFRRIKGFRGMSQLVSALRNATQTTAIDSKANAA